MESASQSKGLHELQARLGFSFSDVNLLVLALTHPSANSDQIAALRNNQRLEFLGDAVLQLVLTEELYTRFPGVGEGPLTKGRAQLVNRNSLAEQSIQLGIGAHLVLSKGEELHGGRERSSILADAFEAVVGAMFLDGGYTSAKQFVLRQFHPCISEVESVPNIENPKGELQERLQAQSNVGPTYRMETVVGPDHDRVFECSVWHLGQELGRGQGKSKKLAETQAALAALKQTLVDSQPQASQAPQPLEPAAVRSTPETLLDAPESVQ